MKKVMTTLVIALLINFVTFAQKSATFVHDGKAIKGYDPVAYFTEGKAVKGNDQFVFEWNDAKWYFASKQNVDLFRNNPAKYAPQYGGYCAYGLSKGYKAPTTEDAWTIDNGKLYLNYNLDVREEWNKDRKARIEQANKNWPTVKNKE